MNTTNLILSQNESFKFVSVSFMDGQTKTYTYKTTLDLAVDDLVVVESPTGFKIVKVVSVLEFHEVNFDVHYEYKWVVSRVDLEYYNECVNVEKEVRKQANKLAYEETRAKLTEQLKDRIGEDALITLKGIAKL